MPLKSKHFRLSTETTLKDLAWLGKYYGHIDQTNTLRVIIAEMKALKAEEMARSKEASRSSS